MAVKTTVDDCKVITLPRVSSRAGNLTAIHELIDLPFHFNRVFYLYDIPGGESRGAHAHKACHQFMVAASGSFDILLNDGKRERLVCLNQPYHGLLIPPLIWAEERNFSSGSICLVLASDFYDADDYIREYDEFLDLRK